MRSLDEYLNTQVVTYLVKLIPGNLPDPEPSIVDGRADIDGA